MANQSPFNKRYAFFNLLPRLWNEHSENHSSRPNCLFLNTLHHLDRVEVRPYSRFQILSFANIEGVLISSEFSYEYIYPGLLWNPIEVDLINQVICTRLPEFDWLVPRYVKVHVNYAPVFKTHYAL